MIEAIFVFVLALFTSLMTVARQSVVWSVISSWSWITLGFVNIGFAEKFPETSWLFYGLGLIFLVLSFYYGYDYIVTRKREVI